MVDSKQQSQTPVFIVSAGRSGSTFLAKLINDHPDIVCVSDLFEPVGPAPYFDRDKTISGSSFFNMIAAPSTKPRLRYWRERQTTERLFVPDDESLVSLLMSYTIPFVNPDPMACLSAYEDFVVDQPEQSPADHLIDFFEWLKKRHNGQLWVERTGGALALTPDIIRTWPEAKIIHNYRDGRECSISMLNYPFFRMYLKMMDNPDLDEWDFDEIPPIESIGQMWSDWVLIAEDAMAMLPESQRCRIAYENLMGKPQHTLEKLIKYIFDKEILSVADNDWISRCLARIKPSSQKFDDLKEADQAKLQVACAPALQRLGYL